MYNLRVLDQVVNKDQRKQLGEIDYLNSKGMLNMFTGRTIDSIPSYLGTNIGMVPSLLTSLSKEVVEMVTAPLLAEELLDGRKKLLDFEQNTLATSIIEKVGKAERYNGYTNPTYVSANLTANIKGHSRLTKAINVEMLREMQMGKAGVSLESELTRAALEGLLIGINDIAFNGDSDTSLEEPVTGLLNDPSLSNYITSTTTKDNASFEVFYNDVNALFARLIEQTKTYVDNDTKMVLGVAQNRWNYLTLVSSFGISVKAALQEIYPNLTFKAIPQFQAVDDNGHDVMYLIAHNVGVGGVSETGVVGYSELGLATPVEQGTSWRIQQFLAGTTGAVIYKPYLIARMQFSS